MFKGGLNVIKGVELMSFGFCSVGKDILTFLLNIWLHFVDS